MKRLLKKLLLLILPFALLLVPFAAFDSYDYFGWNGKPYYMSRPLSSVRTLYRENPENIILGDSRMANLNTGYIEEVSGDAYLSLAFGGASLNEAFELFWYAAEHTDIKKAVIGIDFYRMDDQSYSTAFDDVPIVANNPFYHLTNINAWLYAASNGKTQIKNFINEMLGHPERYVYADPDDPSDLYRPEMTFATEQEHVAFMQEYAGIIRSQCVKYKGASAYRERLVEIIDYCDANGIELVVVIANCSQYIWNDVVFPLRFDRTIENLKDFLKSRVTVYDMDFYNDYARNDDNFLDGFHLVRSEKLHMARAIFNDDFEPWYCFRTTPVQYNEILRLEKVTGEPLLPPLIWEPGYVHPSAEEILAAHA